MRLTRRSVRIWPLLLVVALVVGLFARDAAAGDLRLSWQAPQGCPAAKQVEETALRSVPNDGAREPLDADVLVDHGARWTVTIHTSRGGVTAAERHLEASSCDALADATAIILAMALAAPARAETAAPPAELVEDRPAPAVVAGGPAEEAAEPDRPRGPLVILGRTPSRSARRW